MLEKEASEGVISPTLSMRENDGARTLYRVDQLEAQLMAARQGMRHAEHQFALGSLSKTAFEEMKNHYGGQIRSLVKELRKSSLELRTQHAQQKKVDTRQKKSEDKTTPEKRTILDSPLSAQPAKSKKSKKWPPKKKASTPKKTKK
jgi:hypothetical protein